MKRDRSASPPHRSAMERHRSVQFNAACSLLMHCPAGKSTAFLRVSNQLPHLQQCQTGVTGDPGPGGGVTLGYALPYPGTPGDVLITEPGPTPAPVADILRFNGNGSVIVYSDFSSADPADSLAHNPFPTAFQPNQITL